MKVSKENFIKRKFGQLTVIKQYEDYIGKNGAHYNRWECICDCGNVCVKFTSQLKQEMPMCPKCSKKQKDLKLRKINKYDLSGEYGIGYTNKGEEFYFDLDDYNKIKDYSWSQLSDGYITAPGGIRLHRIIMNVVDSDIEVDHIDHNLANNRKNNLRVCSHQKNMMNKVKYKNNTSGVSGVSWKKDLGKWCVRIQKNNKRIHIGYYDDLENAKKARIEAEKQYFENYRYKGEDDYEFCECNE